MLSIRKTAMLLIVSVVALSVITPSFAQENQQTGSGLVISPTRTELELLPGDETTVEISLRNVSGGDIIAEASVNDFTSDDETGNPQIIPNSEEPFPTSVEPFVSNLQDIELTTEEKKDITLNVKIPEDAAPGAYYGVIRYTAIPKGRDLSERERQIALSASVGSLLLITVPGDITEQIQIDSISVLNEGSAGTFFTQVPNEAAIRIRNNGNTFSKPFGRVVLTRGGAEVFSYELNSAEPKSNVLPSSSRTFKNPLEGVSTPGRYTLTGNISYGKGGEVLTVTRSFWYVPLWLVIVLAVISLVAVIAVVAIVRKIRKRR